MVSPSSNTSRIATTEMRSNFTVAKEQKLGEYNDPFFDRKIENATVGLQSDCYKLFYKISYDNALTIVNYILSMKAEINAADNYRRDNIRLLIRFSKFHHSKAFKQVIREVLTYAAYSETLESEKTKEDKVSAMEERFNNMQGMLEKLITYDNLI
jgi:hypothetical protein